MPTPSKFAAQVAISHLFFLLGLIWGSLAARIPALTDLFSLDKATFGLILLVESIAALLSAPLVGVWIEKYGSRKILTRVIWVYMPLYGLIAFIPHFSLLLVLFAGMGMLAVAYDVAINTQASKIEQYVGKRIIGGLHGFFSLGGFAGALVATLAVKMDWSLRSHLLGIAGFGLCSGLWATRFLLPRPAQNPEAPAARPPRFRLPDRAFIGLGFAALASAIVEGGMGHWSALYMRDIADSSEAFASFAYGLFSFAMLLGRFSIDRFTARFSTPQMVFWGALGAFIGLAMAVFWPHPATVLIGYSIVGIGIAGVFPSLFRTAGHQGAQAVAAVSMMGALGGLIGPPLIGGLSSWGNLRWGLGLMALIALLIAPAARATASADSPPIQPN